MEFEWHPAKLLQDEDSFQDFALLVLHQPLRNSAILRRLWKNGTRRQMFCAISRRAAASAAVVALFAASSPLLATRLPYVIMTDQDCLQLNSESQLMALQTAYTTSLRFKANL